MTLSHLHNRERLPDTRCSITHKFAIRSTQGRIKGFLTIGLYPDGRPGEIFITLDSADDGFRGAARSFCTALSLCLQAGIPVDHLAKKFSYWRYEPSGFTENPDIPSCLSLTDYIGRFLTLTFVTGADDAGQCHSSPGVEPTGSPRPVSISQTTQKEEV
jgi:ribonucleoside-diphosphate reductase alpha chain